MPTSDITTGHSHLAERLHPWLHSYYTTSPSSWIKILALQPAEITEGIRMEQICAETDM